MAHKFEYFDIAKELFSSPVYPGDPVPEKKPFKSIADGDSCNLTHLSMGSHCGTHLDAPKHFVPDGAGVSEIPLSKVIGMCKVVEAVGPVSPEQTAEWLFDGTSKLLIKGEILITPEAADMMASKGLELIGVEGQTVGADGTQQIIHCTLLEAEIVILEGLDLSQTKPGTYFLASQPLKMDGLDGSPVRPILIKL
ncbi:MAG: cyclase family protein [Eubacteriales bacterium]|nr:cyclase family protein [Eubacteriales bacterium]